MTSPSQLTECAAEKDLHRCPIGECLVGLLRGVSRSSDEGSLSEEWLLMREREAAREFPLFTSSCGVCNRDGTGSCLLTFLQSKGSFPT